MKRPFQRCFGLAALILASCTTISTDFEEGTNPEIYFQRAQMAVDRNDYDVALTIYRKLLDSGVSDLYYVVSAQYEIAFLYYKKGQRQTAIQAFEELLRTYYEDPLYTGRVPEWPRVLATRLLQKLRENAGGIR